MSKLWLFLLTFLAGWITRPSVSFPVRSYTGPPHSIPDKELLSDSDSAPIIGFDCNQTEPEVLSVSTLEIKECPEISTLSPTTTLEFGQIIQRHDLESVHVYTCQLTKSTHYFKCGRNWYNYQVYPPSIGVIKEVTPKNCHKVHDSGFYLWSYGKEPWGDLRANRTYHFSANEVGWTDNQGYCEGGTVEIGGTTFKDVVVQSSFTFSIRESWATVDHSTGKINIESTVGCQYKDGSCVDAMTGTHSWTPVAQKCPEDTYRLLYQGPVNMTSSKDNPTILLSINNPPFLFTTEIGASTISCSLSMHLTEFPNIYFLPRSQGSYQLNLPRPGDNDIKFLTYLNSKITFLYHNMMESMQKMYLASLYETCRVEREMLRNRIEIIRLNSASGGLSSILKPGMFAKVNGEIIHLIKCKPVSVQFRNTKDCYESLPIVHNNEHKFLLPNTHIISPYAAIIECSPITPVSYKIGGTWWSYTGNFQRVPEPEILSPSTDFTPKFNKIRTFGKGGMYSSEQIESIQKLLVFPQLRESITTEFVRGVTKFSPSPVALDMTTIMSEADWKTIAKRNLENVWGYFSGIGSAVSGLIGIYFIYKFIKGLLGMAVDANELYKVFGCSFRILASFWGRLAQYFINQSTLSRMDTTTSTSNPSVETQEQPGPSGEPHELTPMDISPVQLETMKYLGIPPYYPTAPTQETGL